VGAPRLPHPLQPPVPNLKIWSAYLIGGKKLTRLGWVEAVDEPAAIEAAVAPFSLNDDRRKRLAVDLRGKV
jgi:hypothetical protein